MVLAVAVALAAAGCRNENPADVQPELPADQVIGEEGVLVEISGDQLASQPIVIPGEDALEKTDSAVLEEIDATFYFGFDQDSLGSAEILDLKALAEDLGKLPGTIMIEGHTDERGPARYNKGLGLRRARAVAGVLEQNGIDKARIQLTSYGSERPAVTGYNERSWAKNRRVELTLVSAD